MMAPGFWDDQEKSQQVTQSLSALKERVASFTSLYAAFEDLQVMLELGEEEDDQSLAEDLQKDLREFKTRLEDMELQVLLNGPYDRGNAILSLHAGAGGTEAQDWVEMLLRMYTRWAEDHGYKTTIADLLPGDEAGVKSATLIVSGPNAFGYLRSEKGVHRLVRISPFDAAGRRHTSMATKQP